MLAPGREPTSSDCENMLAAMRWSSDLLGAKVYITNSTLGVISVKLLSAVGSALGSYNPPYESFPLSSGETQRSSDRNRQKLLFCGFLFWSRQGCGRPEIALGDSDLSEDTALGDPEAPTQIQGSRAQRRREQLAIRGLPACRQSCKPALAKSPSHSRRIGTTWPRW